MIVQLKMRKHLILMVVFLFFGAAKAQAPVTLATLDNPTLFAVDATGNLFAQTVSGDFEEPWTLTYGIAKINPSGAVTSVINPLTTQFGVSSIAMDFNGNFYIRENTGDVNKIAPDGTITPVNIVDAMKIVCDSQGNLLVLQYYSPDNFMLKKITPSGTVSTVIEPGIINRQDNLCVDANGNVYVLINNITTDVDSILKISPNGNYTVLAGNGILQYLNNITCDAAGNLYVVTTANFQNYSIGKLSVQGNYTTLFTNIKPPSAIVVDAAGAVFLSYNPYRQPGTILKFTATGCTPTTSSETITACDTYTWAANSQNYTTSGTYTSVSGCDTKTLELTIKAKPVAPTAVAQTFCGSGTVADLTATGTAVQWYDVATDGIAFASATALITGTTYYASQTINTCESSRTAVAVTITPQPAKPTVACYETATFNSSTCAWEVTGTQATEPTKVNCWDTFVFNTGTCAWDNTGTQAAEPNKVNCWDTFVFNTGTCAWDNTGTQATEPTKVNCWDTFVFNTGTCAWDNTGTQATEPTKVNCWDTFVFNTGTCAWDNTGTQATEPIKVNSWDNFVFNITSCSWGNIGTPTNSTKIQNSQCGVTLAVLSTVIVPIAVPLAQGYKYKVTNTATNAVRYYTRSKTATFALSQSADSGSSSESIKLSSTYAIAVAVKINGVFSAYGDACLVSTPLLPTTKIQDALCGNTLANINSYLYLKAQVAGQKGYRFKVTQGAEERIYDRAYGSYIPFQLKQLVGGAAYATTYEIAVSVFYNGAWQPYGETCTVTTPAAIQSKLATTQCGITLNKTNTNVLTANYVGVAQAYRFEVSKGASTYTVETASGLLRTFKMTEVPGLTLESGATYSIRVAIKANGTWQPYGTSCNVITYGSPAIVKMADPLAKPESVFNALAYPNPFSSAFQLKLNTSSKVAVDLKVYDVLGRLIENRQWNAAEASEQEIGNNYPSGVYNIILNQGENVKTLRVIKR